MKDVKTWLKRSPWVVAFYQNINRYFISNLTLNPWQTVKNYYRFFIDLRRYRRLGGEATWSDLYPKLLDKTTTTPLDPFYFYQDTWLAGKVFKLKPTYHVDVGSTALLVGILSQYTQVCSVDIRPLPVNLPNLDVRQGSILNMPFEDGELFSVSSLCVIEHVGLGRYGDPLDPRGTEKAIDELCRVLAPDGDLYLSVPIGVSSRVCFNAHRIFNPQGFIEKIAGLEISEFSIVRSDGIERIDDILAYDTSLLSGLAIGLFHFRTLQN